MDLTFFENLITAAGPQITALLALVAANVILGVAVAIKEKKFEWAKLADFYISDIVPKLLGYVAVVILVEFGALEYLGPDLAGQIEGGLLMEAWLAVVVSIGGDILKKLASLGITIAERLPGI